MFKKYAYPRELRLLQQQQFRDTLAAPQPLVGGYFVLYHQPNNQTHPRLGVITSKRKFRLAVWRNQLKRLARESFRLNQHRIAGYDVVLIARQAARGTSKCELRQCLDNLFLQLATADNKS